MSDKIKIAIDAMGGENSPKKIIDGIDLSLNQIEAGITVETRDADHVTQVINSLREAGYTPEPPPTPQAQASILYFRGQDT